MTTKAKYGSYGSMGRNPESDETKISSDQLTEESALQTSEFKTGQRIRG